MYPSLVTNGDWSVAYVSGSEIQGTQLWLSKRYGFKTRKSENDHRLFPDLKTAEQFCLERGYVAKYYGRPSAFIWLRLSPATRRFLRNKPESERWAWLKRLLPRSEKSTYFRSVEKEACCASTRQDWRDYMAGKNPESIARQRIAQQIAA